MDSLCERLNSSLRDLDHEVFQNVVKVDIDAKTIGDEQVVIVSEIKRANLTLETSSGKKKTLCVITKLEPTNEGGKTMADEFKIFENESMMYSDVLKTMGKIMFEKNDSDRLWADCYYAKDNKFIFQDLGDVGYKVVPTYKFLDYDHTVLTMEALGKFHGLSMVMVQRNLLDKTKLNPFVMGTRPKVIINFHKMFLMNLAKSMASWGPEWETPAKNLKKMAANPGETLYQMCELFKDKWCVLNHGDFSMRNIMFHYSPDSTKPDKIKFIDFQMCHYSHYAFDVAYLLYGSVRPKVRDDNMDTFLNAYINGLKSTCELHGYKGPLPTVEETKASFKAMPYFTSTNSIQYVSFFIASKQKDVQSKADDCMNAFADEEVSDEFHSEQEDIFFTGEEIKEEMKYEIKRMMKENII